MWELELRTGDRLVLCSDGLTNEVGSDEMAGILGEVDDPAEAAQRLVEAANEHGGADNITVVVIDVQVGEEGDGRLHQGDAAAPRRRRAGRAWPPRPPSRWWSRPAEADTVRDRSPSPRPAPAARARPRARCAAAALRRHGGRSGGRPGRDAGTRLPPRLRRRADHAGRDGTAQRRVLHGHDGRRCRWPAPRRGSRRPPATGEPTSRRARRAAGPAGGGWASRAASRRG